MSLNHYRGVLIGSVLPEGPPLLHKLYILALYPQSLFLAGLVSLHTFRKVAPLIPGAGGKIVADAVESP